MKLTIDPEFEALIPPLAPEELKQLHSSLCADGCLSPLIVWQGNNVLVDGHNRYKYLTKNKMQFEAREIEFSNREEVKRFIILNQLGRRNVTPETATALRGIYYLSMKKGQGGDHGNQHTVPKDQNDTLPDSTAEQVAKETGSSPATVKRAAKLVEALQKLGISEADYMSQKVLDANGKKRTKKSIIEEAFPSKAKAKPKKKKPDPEPPQEAEPLDIQQDEQDAPEVEEMATNSTSAKQVDHWFNCLNSLDKITQEQRQELYSILSKRWDCRL